MHRRTQGSHSSLPSVESILTYHVFYVLPNAVDWHGNHHGVSGSTAAAQYHAVLPWQHRSVLRVYPIGCIDCWCVKPVPLVVL